MEIFASTDYSAGPTASALKLKMSFVRPNLVFVSSKWRLTPSWTIARV